MGFELDRWPVLGAPVKIDLSPGTVVLVGRNGAGKSLILEGLHDYSRPPVPRTGRRGPGRLTFDFETPSGRRLRYERWREPTTMPPLESTDLSGPRPPASGWSDRCAYQDRGFEVVWETSQLVAKFSNEMSRIVVGDGGPFSLLHHEDFPLALPIELSWVHLGLRTDLVRPTIGRRNRRDVVHRRSKLRPLQPLLGRVGDTAEAIARTIVARSERSALEEFSLVCKRLKLVEEITVLSYESKPNTAGDEEFVEVLFDKVNVGLLSDGTLRVLDILLKLIYSPPHRTLLIEEPEVAVHPGLLAGLLAEIHSYSHGRTLLISSHSPQIVSWASADQLRVVRRLDGQTSVQALSAGQKHRLVEYMSNDGDPGSWIFGGGLDDE